MRVRELALEFAKQESDVEMTQNALIKGFIAGWDAVCEKIDPMTRVQGMPTIGQANGALRRIREYISISDGNVPEIRGQEDSS